jgi:hypothetical protein
MDVSILNTTPSSIKAKVGEKTVTIEGESFAPGYGSPDFLIFENSVKRWDPPYAEDAIEPDMAAQIVAKVVQILEERKWKVEVE